MEVLALLILGAAFGLIVIFGAPYLPTHQRQLKLALDLADLKPDQLLLDLGAGDGRLLKAAAQRGWRATGYELNPFLVLWCWLSLRRYRSQTNTIWRDFLRTSWPADTTAVYIFGSRPVMRRLAIKLMVWPTPLRLVSYGFELPGHKHEIKSGGFFVYDLKPKTPKDQKHHFKS